MLTKSDFVKYLQCPKYLWLYKRRKDLLSPEVDYNLQKVFDMGYEVEAEAYKLFPGGVNAQVEGFNESIAQTKQLMAQKSPIIFQPTISGQELFCRADIIQLSDDGESWDIYEVKSATTVKDLNIHDLAFQKICFESNGYKIGQLHLICVNNQYVRHGEIDPQQLLQIENVSIQAQALEANIKAEIEVALETSKKTAEPITRILKQCREPYPCPFLDYCWKDIPDHSIYEIAGGLSEEKLNHLIDEGILEIKDIPDGVITSPAGLRQHHAVKHNEVHIEPESIAEELMQLQYPLYFLDYETFAPGVPLFDGYRPYQRMTFQYSLHVQDTPGGEVKHFAYLASGWADPSLGLAKDLKKRIGDTGSVIAWNMSFEKGCNSEMADRYPKFASFFESLNNRMFDLMQVFKKGFYVHKDFHGSASLKKVLPVMVPELSYGDLDIGEGGTASNKWRDMIDPKTSQDEAKEIYDNLLSYCELDTLAMVRILEELRKLIN